MLFYVSMICETWDNILNIQQTMDNYGYSLILHCDRRFFIHSNIINIIIFCPSIRLDLFILFFTLFCKELVCAMTAKDIELRAIVKLFAGLHRPKQTL